MSLAGCIISIHMNKMDGSSTYSQPLGRMHHARGITATPRISERQHLNDLVDGSQVTSHKAPAFLCGRRKAKEASWHRWKSCKSLALQSLANLSRPQILLISRVAPKISCLKCQILIYISCVNQGIFAFRNRSPLPHNIFFTS